MTTDVPVAGLKRLWKQAFADPDAFIDAFFLRGFSPDRFRCIRLDGQVAAALYWFDCHGPAGKIAYIYAVATEEAFRGRGLCRRLMAGTHAQLLRQGYSGAILVPGEPGLFRMYGAMGYRVCSRIREFTCLPADPIPLRRLTRDQYAHARRQFLPQGGVVQEGENLAFLDAYARFYAGDGFVLCAAGEKDALFVPELLGTASGPGIAAALGADSARIRTPGQDRDFAMYRSLDGAPAPDYFGLAFD